MKFWQKQTSRHFPHDSVFISCLRNLFFLEHIYYALQVSVFNNRKHPPWEIADSISRSENVKDDRSLLTLVEWLSVSLNYLSTLTPYLRFFSIIPFPKHFISAIAFLISMNSFFFSAFSFFIPIYYCFVPKLFSQDSLRTLFRIIFMCLFFSWTRSLPVVCSVSSSWSFMSVCVCMQLCVEYCWSMRSLILDCSFRSLKEKWIDWSS